MSKYRNNFRLLNEMVLGNENKNKQIFENFLEAVNDKLIQNLEENVVLKFNMKELLDLNQTNQNQVKKFINILVKFLFIKFILT
jgi:hypothetical protein